MFSSVLVIVPFLAGINALNDWSVPCTSGSCSYDLAATPNAPSGTLKIWGSTNAITDITTAAGWQILGCDPTAHNQSIRLVCTEDPNDANSNCNHLYQSIGAVNKIVRLPQSCGASAFARVAKSWVPDDQSIPSSVRRRIVRRDGAAPVVKALAIDTNFDAVDWSQTGMVNIAIQGANVPGAPTEIKTSNSRRSLHARNHQRDVRSFLGSITDGIKNAGDAVANAATAAAGAVKSVATEAATAAKDAATDAATKAADAATKAESAVKDAATGAASKVDDAATKAADAAKDAATKAADDAKNAATKAADAAKNAATKAADAAKNAATKAESIAAGAATAVAGAAGAAASDAAAAAKSVANNTIDVSKSFDLPPINFNKNINLINSAVTCGSTSLSMQVDMDAQANAQITLAIAATGTIVPPNIKSFGVIAGMTATVAGTMTMTADLSGALSSGQIQLVNIGIPGLDFPGIFTVGPSFQVNAQVDGNVDVQMDLTVGINYNVNNAKITFPPDNSTAPDSAAFTAGDTPLTLNAAPDVTATGQITAHLIPSINLGINALGGKAEAQISLALDANAALNMNLDGSISKTGTIDNSAAADNSTTTDDSSSADNSTVTDDGSGNSTATDDGSGQITNVDQEGGDTEVFQNPDGSLVDQFGNNVTDTGDLVDPTSAVDASGNLLNGGALNATADAADGITNASQETGDTSVFQNPDGSLVDQFGNNVTDTGDLVDPSTAVDADGNLLNPGPDDGSAGNSTLITNVTDETGDQTVFQNPDGSLVDQFGNNVTDTGDLVDPTTAVDADGNPLNPGAAGITNVALETGDQSVFQNPDGSLVDQFGNPVTDTGDLVDPSTAVDADGNFLNPGDGSDSTDDASADDSTTDDSSSSNSTITSRADDNSTDVSTSSTSSLGGCVNVAGNVNLKATATGSFFGLFDQVQSKPFFNKDFQIFNKCFGSDATNGTAAASGSDNSTTPVVDDGSEDIFDDGNGGFVDADGNPVDDSGLPLDGTASGSGNSTTPVVDDGSEDIFDDGNGGFEDADGNPVDDSGLPLDGTAPATRRRRFAQPTELSSLERRVSFTCPFNPSSKKLSVTKGTVKAASVTSKSK